MDGMDMHEVDGVAVSRGFGAAAEEGALLTEGSPLAVEVRGLVVRVGADGPTVLDGVDLAVRRGETLAVVGASGAGKSTLARVLLGSVGPGLVWDKGHVTVDGCSVRGLGGRDLRRLRGRRVAYLVQDPALSLTPWMRVGELLAEVGADGDRANELLAAVGLDGVAQVLRRRPAELSGGQRRRVALARAMVGEPAVLVLDEPTSGLDNAASEDVLATVSALRERRGTAVIAVTHDLQVAARLGGDVAVMEGGRVVERGQTRRVFAGPDHAYTRELLAATRLARPDGAREEAAHEVGAMTGPEAAPAPGAAPKFDEASVPPFVLRVDGLCVTTPDGKRVVDNLSFTLKPGGGIALVGPSGAGKTTLVNVLVGRWPPDAGRLELWDGTAPVDLAARFEDRSESQLMGVQMVPQDPATSLNPALTVRIQLARACKRRYPSWSKEQLAKRLCELMGFVGLEEALLRHRPGRLSGGQAQRVAIARALAYEPAVLVLDESTSALDAVTQRDVLAMLDHVCARTGVAVVVVTHEPRVASYLCDQTVTVGATGSFAFAAATPGT